LKANHNGKKNDNKKGCVVINIVKELFESKSQQNGHISSCLVVINIVKELFESKSQPRV